MNSIPSDLVNKIIDFTPWYILVRNDIPDTSGVVEEFMNSHFAYEVSSDDLNICDDLIVTNINRWLESLTEDDIETWVNKIGIVKLLKEYKRTYTFTNIDNLIDTITEPIIHGWILFCHIQNRVTFELWRR